MRLMPTIHCQSSSGVSIIVPAQATPALLIMTSSPSFAVANVFTATVSSSACVTSPG